MKIYVDKTKQLKKKRRIEKDKKQSTARIPKWSPTLVLTDPHVA